MTSIEETSLWNTVYGSSGSFTYAKEIPGTDLTRTITVPPSMESLYIPDRRYLRFFSRSEEDSNGKWYGMGMIFQLSDERANFVREIDLITPGEDGGTLTLSFPLKRRLPWLALKEGEQSATYAYRKSYKAIIARVGATTWEITLDPSGIRATPPWVTSARFAIDTSAPRPPWTALRVYFEVRNDRGRAYGEFVLSRPE